jgi:hypothetical protein
VAFRFAVARLPLRGQRRVWFSQATKTRTGFPFHSPSLSGPTQKTPAKHLTTSETMLTAVKAIGKLRSISLSIPTHKEFYIERLLN